MGSPRRSGGFYAAPRAINEIPTNPLLRFGAIVLCGARPGADVGPGSTRMQALRSVVATILFVIFSGQAIAEAPSPQVSCLSGAFEALLPSSLLDELATIAPAPQAVPA